MSCGLILLTDQLFIILAIGGGKRVPPPPSTPPEPLGNRSRSKLPFKIAEEEDEEEEEEPVNPFKKFQAATTKSDASSPNSSRGPSPRSDKGGVSSPKAGSSSQSSAAAEMSAAEKPRAQDDSNVNLKHRQSAPAAVLHKRVCPA